MLDKEIELMDEREKIHGYKRTLVRKEDIESINFGLRNEDESVIWAYSTENPLFPTKNNPIAQSYVDVIIHGCLEQGEDFALQFVDTTDGWNGTWVNDRRSPRYRRALGDLDYTEIDRILKRVVSHRTESS